MANNKVTAEREKMGLLLCDSLQQAHREEQKRDWLTIIELFPANTKRSEHSQFCLEGCDIIPVWRCEDNSVAELSKISVIICLPLKITLIQPEVNKPVNSQLSKVQKGLKRQSFFYGQLSEWHKKY